MSHPLVTACLRGDSAQAHDVTEGAGTMDAQRRIAVTGATGRVGRHVVELLWAQGHEAVPIARSAGVDVITGEGLDAALAGVDTIVDTATGPVARPGRAPRRSSRPPPPTSSTPASARASAAWSSSRSSASTASSGGYMAAKLAQEQALLAGPIPTRIVRGRPVPRVRRAVPRVGPAGRRRLRAAHADAARRRPRRRPRGSSTSRRRRTRRSPARPPRPRSSSSPGRGRSRSRTSRRCS